MAKKGVIKHVEPGSIAHRVGLLPGDEILKINNCDFEDFLDYKFLMTDERVSLIIRDSKGSLKKIIIDKEFDEGIGVEFENPLMDNIKRCKNKCVFCFVDQMPPGLRKSLYVKDDDYRLSTAFGTFITLTNVSERDFERIVKMHLSPLYVSVHATSPDVRRFMMKNPKAGEGMEKLEYLARHHIFLHCQVVLCPGINDGEVLEKTLRDLSQLWPQVLSIAVVPVGLTRFRQRLYPLKAFTKEEAGRVIDFIERFQTESLNTRNTRLVFAADEFYCIAERKVPSCEAYEDFYQLENGVGMMALLKKEINENLPNIPTELSDRRWVTIATGVSAYEFLTEVLRPLERVKNLEYRVLPVINNFFGPSVTVAGLVTGADLIKQLKTEKLGDIVLIPEVMLKDKKVFLDDVSVEDVGKNLSADVKVVDVSGKAFLEAILGKKMGETL